MTKNIIIIVCALFLLGNFAACVSSAPSDSLSHKNDSINIKGSSVYSSSNINDRVESSITQSMGSSSEVIEETRYYKIIRDNFKFTYYLYDDKHKITCCRTLDGREPEVSLIRGNILKVRIQAGTGIETVQTYYYDIKQHKFSRIFDGTFAECGDLVVFMKSLNVLTVENMFNPERYYKEISYFKYKLSSTPLPPFSDVQFIDGGKMLKVTYYTANNSKEETETFPLE